jgi:hypothetical protein
LGQSPCRDTGKNNSWMETAHDLQGQKRLVGTTVDMGAYEYMIGGTVFMLN